MVARVKKRYELGRVVEVIREVVRATPRERAVHSLLQQTQRSAQALINTAYIERGSMPPSAPGSGTFSTPHPRRGA